MQDGEDGRKKFELPGSEPHYAPSLLFTINHMKLLIEPDFGGKSITGSQVLKITALQDTDIIELDAAELQVKSVSTAKNSLDFRAIDDKLAIKLGRALKEGQSADLFIEYS